MPRLVVPDTTSPTVPTGLSATPISSTQINLSWTASTDNVGVTGYKVYRGGALVGSPATTSYSDTGLTASTSYSYTLAACDAANNCSAQSNPVSATTMSATTSSNVRARQRRGGGFGVKYLQQRLSGVGGQRQPAYRCHLGVMEVAGMMQHSTPTRLGANQLQWYED